MTSIDGTACVPAIYRKQASAPHAPTWVRDPMLMDPAGEALAGIGIPTSASTHTFPEAEFSTIPLALASTRPSPFTARRIFTIPALLTDLVNSTIRTDTVSAERAAFVAAAVSAAAVSAAAVSAAAVLA